MFQVYSAFLKNVIRSLQMPRSQRMACCPAPPSSMWRGGKEEALRVRQGSGGRRRAASSGRGLEPSQTAVSPRLPLLTAGVSFGRKLNPLGPHPRVCKWVITAPVLQVAVKGRRCRLLLSCLPSDRSGSGSRGSRWPACGPRQGSTGLAGRLCLRNEDASVFLTLVATGAG